MAPLLCGAGQLVLELILCGSQSGGAWVWLLPLLRVADLWLLWLTVLWMLRLTGQPARAMLVAAAVPLAVYSAATHFLPQAAGAASAAFVAFSVVLLWYAGRMLRAYNAARVAR